MILAGWDLKGIKDHPNARFEGRCGTETFWGYKYGNPVGKISYPFKGDGEAMLKFGNCYEKGRTKVYLNKDLIASTTIKRNITIGFEYKTGDILRVEERNSGIFIIHSLKISCNGKVASTEK